MATDMETDNIRIALQDAYAEESRRLASLPAEAVQRGEIFRPVFGEGKPEARVVLIGEAPGREETEAGRPFVGKAGRQLDALFSRFGIDRTNAYITNVVKYRPCVRGPKSVRNRTPDRDEIDASLPLLETELSLICPCVILTLGNTPLNALRALAGMPRAVIGRLHGAPYQITLGPNAAVTIALYHPASGIYNRDLIQVMEADAEKVRHFLRARGCTQTVDV